MAPKLNIGVVLLMAAFLPSISAQFFPFAELLNVAPSLGPNESYGTLETLSVGTSKGSSDVFQKGKPLPAYQRLSSNGTGDERTRIPVDVVASSFFFSNAPGKAQVAKRIVAMAHKPNCRPKVTGPLSLGGVIRAPTEGDMQSITVEYDCVQQGDCPVSIIAPLVNHNRSAETSFLGPIASLFVQPLVVNFVVVKICPGATQASSSVPYFGLQIGTSPAHNDVMADGVVQNSFRRLHKLVDSEPNYEIPATETSSVFYVSLRSNSPRDNITFEAPTVVAQSNGCKPRVTGDLAMGGVQTKESMRQFSVEYNCLAAGRTVVDILLPFSGPVEFILFSVTKVCPDQSKTDAVPRGTGYGLPGLNLGTIAGKTDVISNGYTSLAFRRLPGVEGNQTLRDLEMAQRHVYSGDVHETILFLQRTTPNTANVPPMVLRRASFIVEPPIAEPTFGPFMTGMVLNSSDVIPLSVQFNCRSTGSAMIVVKIPVEPNSFVGFALFKTCTVTIPGTDTTVPKIQVLNIKRELDDKEENVVVDSETVPAYTAKVKPELVRFPASERSTTFYLSLGATNNNGGVPENVTFERPSVLAHYRVCNPRLSGDAIMGGQLVAGDVLELSLTYYCFQNATTPITVMVPVSQAGLSKELRFTFEKTCSVGVDRANDDEDEGDTLFGFNIGTQPYKSDVVKNGHTQSNYVKGRLRVSSEVAIQQSTPAATFYITSANRTQRFGRPLVVVHQPDIVEVELAGMAVAGGKASTGQSVDLIMNFACLLKGTTQVTVTMPLRPAGFSTFTVTKSCNGTALAKRVVIPGLRMGTGPGVLNVFNAEALPKYSLALVQESGNASSLAVIPHANATTDFYIWAVDVPEFTVEMGVAWSVDTFLNPAVHQIPDAGLKVSNKFQKFTISYNCIRGGDAVVVVSLFVSNYGEARFAVLKRCSRGPLEKEISESFSGHEDEDSDYDDDMDDPLIPADAGLNDNPTFDRNDLSLDIGTAEFAADVVHEGVPMPLYKLPTISNPSKSDRLQDYTKVFGNRVKEATYYLTSGKEVYVEAISAVVGKPKVVAVKLIGDIVKGGPLNHAKSQSFTAQFECLQDGVTDVSFHVQEVHAQVAFLVTKVCGLQSSKYGGSFFSRSLGTIVLIVGLALSLAGTYYLYKQYNRRGHLYTPVSTNPTTVADVEMPERPKETSTATESGEVVHH